MKLLLHTLPSVPLEAEVICPDQFVGKSLDSIAAMTVMHGNQACVLTDFFTLTDDGLEAIEVEGDLSKVKLIGSEMSQGKIIIKGSVGAHLGALMTGGEILVTGNAEDWVGREMSGGRIVIKGNAGHLVGSGVRGSDTGIQGGEIIIHGNAKNEVGNGMRRGLIVIGGNSGDFTGVNMKAGTIMVLGRLGQRPGASMVRGTIFSTQTAQLLPTFTYNTTYKPTFLKRYLIYLKKLGFTIDDAYLNGKYQSWSGDSLELNKGEILLFSE